MSRFVLLNSVKSPKKPIDAGQHTFLLPRENRNSGNFQAKYVDYLRPAKSRLLIFAKFATTMARISEIYKKHVYGIMGTLIFHILIVSGFLVAEINVKKEAKEEAILIDFSNIPEKPEEVSPEKKQTPEEKSATEGQTQPTTRSSSSNQAVNDALKKDKFFDKAYQQEIQDAQKLVSDVNKQLAKKIPEKKSFSMPEVTTEGQDPDSVKNTVYSGKSNIHYFLENRHHVRLPVPVYLAKGGGIVVVDIVVDRSGRVIKAATRPSPSIKDPMLPEYAQQAAENTVFNADAKAPAAQKGTITYTFVPQ